jgi:hypothetical protein
LYNLEAASWITISDSRLSKDLEACTHILSRDLQERREERKKEKRKYTHSELEQVLTPDTIHYVALQLIVTLMMQQHRVRASLHSVALPAFKSSPTTSD